MSGNGWQREHYLMDALGNIHESRSYTDANPVYAPADPRLVYTLALGSGRVREIHKTDTNIQEPFDNDDATREHDASGNVIIAMQTIEVGGYPNNTITRNYYDAEDRLRVTQLVAERNTGNEGVWEEYRYDALGRRVLVRSSQETACTMNGTTCFQLCAGPGITCTSNITRYVWAGDQILWELRSPGQDSDNLELTDGVGTAYGQVSYFHAGGIDRPLSIWKKNVGSVLPHENWRGQFAMGIWGVGAVGSSGSLRGKRSDCSYGGAPDCIPLAWPGFSTNAWGKTSAQGGTTGDPTYWMGSLVNGMRDRTGQQYMRNRYYDPVTGQFTQADPIGLKGGLNGYGFAAGDPVSYSDPYGLRVCAETRYLRRAIEKAVNASIEWDITNCVSSTDEVHYFGGAAWSEIQQQFGRFVVSPNTYHVKRGGPGQGNPLGCNPGCSWYESSTRTAWIFDQDFDRRLPNGEIQRGTAYEICGFSWFGFRQGRYSLPGLILHELFGHGQFATPLLATHQNPRIYTFENAYNRIHGRPERCYR